LIVPSFFASDIHLRTDHPERGERLARWVDGLSPEDALYLAGDVCDFWFTSRRRPGDESACEGLRSLARFRARGGSLTILPGNHDAWLGGFYEQALGARFVDTTALDLVEYGLRVHVVHGHRLGSRPPWKGVMESQGFLLAFRALPGPLASSLSRVLDRSNDASKASSDHRHLVAYRRYADTLADRADLVVFGHTHLTLDDAAHRPRLIVLGDWDRHASFLRIDEQGAHLLSQEDAERVQA
jgi:UDP-2,3-diacylglucosamine hydrolase